MILVTNFIEEIEIGINGETKFGKNAYKILSFKSSSSDSRLNENRQLNVVVDVTKIDECTRFEHY